MLISELLGENAPSSSSTTTAAASSLQTVKMTERAKTELEGFSQSFPKTGNEFKDFVKSKMANPTIMLGKKDVVGTHAMRGWNHVHLIFGKVIVSYKISNNELLIGAITDHKPFDGANPTNLTLSTYLKNLSPTEFEGGYTASSDQSEKESILEKQAKETVVHLFKDMANNTVDRKLLTRFSSGIDDGEVMFFIEALDDNNVNKLSKQVLQTLAKEVLGGKH